MLDLEVQSALVGAFVTVAVMTSTLLRRRRQRTDALFAVLCIVLVLWFLTNFLRGAFGSDMWIRLELALASLVPAAMLRVFSELVPLQISENRFMGSVYPMAVLMAVASLSPLGRLPIVQAGVALYIGTTILLTSRLMLDSGDVAKGTVEYARRRYLAFGASVVTILAIFGESPPLQGSATAVGHLSVMLYIFFLSQVILRERLLDLNEFIGRMFVLGILAVLFAAISALLISLGNTTSTRLFGALVGVIILLTLYEPLKVRLEARAMELFFRERHRFLQNLDDLRRRMQHGVLDPDTMSRIVADALYDSRRCTHVAVYLLEPHGNGFELHAYRGPEPKAQVSATQQPVLWQTINQTRAPVLAEQIARDEEALAEGHRRDLLQAMRAVSGDVLLPFVSGETVLGFVAVRDDRSAESVSTTELAGLMMIAETPATVIWNSRLAERLRERERLAADGAMAAGLAHEIRNPLGAIKGAAEYLDPASLQNADESEFLQVIIEETDRLNSVVSQFLDYARPFRVNLQPTALNQVVQKTAKLVEAQRGPTRVSLKLDDRVPTIQADGEQLHQVILNLVLNGLEASRNLPDPVLIETRSLPERGLIELRVTDRGCGIPPEDLNRVFIPFFTTKQQGTGLGLAVCQRIIHNHGGSIYPESRIGEGTSFVVQLPIQLREVMATTSQQPRPRHLTPLPRFAASGVKPPAHTGSTTPATDTVTPENGAAAPTAIEARSESNSN